MTEKMSDADRKRCERLRYQSKKGKYLPPPDFIFLQKMYRMFPDEYKAIGDAVKEETTAELNPLSREEHGK